MSKYNLIISYFDFLRDYGFRRKRFDNGVDYEVIYSKWNFVVEVYCDLCVLNTNSNDIDAMFKNAFYDVWVVIQKIMHEVILLVAICSMKQAVKN